MGTIPTPPTFGTNGVAPSTLLNQLRDATNFLLNPPLAVLRATVAGSVPNGTWTPMLFDVEEIDRDNGHSTVSNTSRYTAQTLGWYHVDTVGTFVANATGLRAARLSVNGSPAMGRSNWLPPNGAGQTSTAPVSGPVFLNPGDYLELQVFQSSGAALNTSIDGAGAVPFLAVCWISS